MKLSDKIQSVIDSHENRAELLARKLQMNTMMIERLVSGDLKIYDLKLWDAEYIGDYYDQRALQTVRDFKIPAGKALKKALKQSLIVKPSKRAMASGDDHDIILATGMKWLYEDTVGDPIQMGCMLYKMWERKNEQR